MKAFSGMPGSSCSPFPPSTFLFILTMTRVNISVNFESWYRKDHDKVKELIEAIEKIKVEFESIERPKLEVETPTQASETPTSGAPLIVSPKTPTPAIRPRPNRLLKSLSFTGRISESSEIQDELDKFCEDDSADEICEWEFDAPEKVGETRR